MPKRLGAFDASDPTFEFHGNKFALFSMRVRMKTNAQETSSPVGAGQNGGS